jgi:hypothetical protein
MHTFDDMDIAHAEGIRGRLAKVTSCSVKHSLAIAGDVTTMVLRKLRHSEKSGRAARRDGNGTVRRGTAS